MRARRAPIGARHPRLTIAAAIVVLLGLGLLGLGVDDELKATSLNVPGTESSRGEQMLREHFGDAAPFAILLRGPAAALDRQGPRLVAAVRRDDPRVTSVSPWERRGTFEALRPDRRTALVLVDYHVDGDTAMDAIAPHLERLVAENVAAPVRGRAAGFATVARAIRETSMETTRRGELILAPILLIVLLFVFRSPVAAAIPLVFGAITVVGARGLISVLAGFVDINGFALSIATMIGLAIGVDYALLIVSRFREELAGGADPLAAATATRMTAGRTTVFAGGILLMAVVIAVCLVPGDLLLSLCATVAPAILVAVAGPWIVGPAVLVLVGNSVDRWRIGRRGPVRTRWLAISYAALRQPRVAAAAVGLLLLTLAVPATLLPTGPVTIEELADDDPARLDVEAIKAAVGGGWISPTVVVAVSEHGPVTARGRIRALDRWQAEVAAQPGIEAVIGPGPLVARVAPLRRVGKRFLADDGGAQGANLRRAGRGLRRLRRGLGSASEGAHALAVGSGRAEAGASLLSYGLSLASSGSGRARRALDRFRRGTHLLAGGQRSMGLGLSLLGFGVDELSAEVGRRALPRAQRIEAESSAATAGLPVSEAAATQTLERLEAAWRELGSLAVDPADPHYQALSTALREALTAAGGTDPVSAARFAPGYEGLPRALAELGEAQRQSLAEVERLQGELAAISESIGLLRRLSTRLQGGVARLEAGSQRLADGTDRIAGGADRVGSGVERLANGAQRLEHGLERIEGGNARLARGLSHGYQRMQPLVAGARRAETGIRSARERLAHGSPHIFDSGYFPLSALDGARQRPRELAGQAIDLDSGEATKLLVVDSDEGLNRLEMGTLNDRLQADAERLAERSGMAVAITGGVAQSVDYVRATSSRLLPLVVSITLVTFLLMLIILRALPLAALAIGLNLLTVASAFGVLELLTLLPPDWPFGGTNHIDPVSAAGIFGVVFGISIDYAVFLMMRMREGWERDGDNDAAIAYGLERTASVITGAATIMTCVFVILATAPIQSVAQFGTSLTVVVVLDATAVRLMLVPALMKLIGPRIWWMPAWAERHLPRLNVHGDEVAL